MTTALWTLLFLGAMTALGRWLVRPEGEGPGGSLGVSFTAGVLSAWVLWTVLDETGLGWGPATLLSVFVVAALLASVARLRSLRSGSPGSSATRELGRGLAVAGPALAIWAVHSVAAWRLWTLHPDFIWHWGVKAGRYAATGGVDWSFLSRDWNAAIHPGYPDLVSSLQAILWILAGGRDERAVAVTTSVLFLLLLLTGAGLLLRLGVRPLPASLALAATAALVGRFAVVEGLAGGADWWSAFAALLGVGGILAAQGGSGDRTVGLAGGLAAAVKLEGAALAIALAVGRWRAVGGRWSGNRLSWVRILGPAVAVISIWQIRLRLHGVPVASPGTTLSFDRSLEVAREVAVQLGHPSWWGAPFAFAILPWILLRSPDRRLRGAALALTLQLGFYVAVYVVVAVDPADLWVRLSVRRLWFHLLPATLLLAAAVLGSDEAAGQGDRAPEG